MVEGHKINMHPWDKHQLIKHNKWILISISRWDNKRECRINLKEIKRRMKDFKSLRIIENIQ